jgi:hypothetical protein
MNPTHEFLAPLSLLCTTIAIGTAALSPLTAQAEAKSGKVKFQKVETYPSTASSGATESAGTYGADWKGTPEPSPFSLGALAGFGLVNYTGGFTLLPTASAKIAKDGWLADVNDAVSIEAGLGPIFITGATSLFYTAHLRWDFQKDRNWIFYAIGGVAGFNTSTALGDDFQIFPRFGVGAMYDMQLPVLFRFELSHELIALGVNIPLF